MRILYLDIDSLRPDHLGCYGYHRNTSPHIDAIAKESRILTNCHTTDAPCLPSRTALYTGQFGIHSGVVSHTGLGAEIRQDGHNRGFRDSIESQSFGNFLQTNGYYTAQISPFAQRHSARHFYAGFNEMINTGHKGMESAEEVTPVVQRWLEQHAKEDNWYLHLNYWDPHTPYRTPADYENPFLDDPLPEWITDTVLEEHQQKIGPHGAREVMMWHSDKNPKFPKHPPEIRNREHLREMIDGYDMGVRYVDDQIGIIVQMLKEAGVYEDTAIIISADHGENLGELGIYGEHATADYATTRIPMIIRWPGVVESGVTESFQYNIDWPATVAAILGQEPFEKWDGSSYLPALKGESHSGRETLVVGQCAHVCQRAVRFDDWMYIRTYHGGGHLFPKEMLFNIKDDPYEQKDLAKGRPEICREAAYRLLEWQEGMMATMPHDSDPLWTVMHEGGPGTARGKIESYIERLRGTDREWAIPELEQMYLNTEK